MDQAGQRQISLNAGCGAASRSNSRRRAPFSEFIQQVEVWAELQVRLRPRVYGFWDGDSSYRPSA